MIEYIGSMSNKTFTICPHLISKKDNLTIFTDHISSTYIFYEEE